MPAKIADASVIAAAAFGEDRAEEAWDLLDGIDLYEPRLLEYELTSVARKKVLRDPAQQPAIEAALSVALGIGFRWVDVVHLEVLQLAVHTRLSTYDACYLWLARRLALPLLTFDARLQAAV